LAIGDFLLIKHLNWNDLDWSPVLFLLDSFMRHFFVVIACWLGLSLSSTAFAQTAAPTCSPLLSHTFLRLQDEVPQNLCQYQGDVILVVNTASYCGFTGQYDDLEKIYSKYQKRGFVVLGFPSNDFGQQEPGTNKQIADFCKNTYDVKFPMFSKSNVSGKNPNPLFKALIEKTGTTPKWNFYKYLIDRNGNVVEAYGSLSNPSGRTITSHIEKLLQGKQ
jgi:glutathione peroxidase